MLIMSIMTNSLEDNLTVITHFIGLSSASILSTLNSRQGEQPISRIHVSGFAILAARGVAVCFANINPWKEDGHF